MIIKRWLAPRNIVYFMFIVCVVTVILWKSEPAERGETFKPYDTEFFAKVQDSIFDGFDNITGTKNGSYIVPNYVHFLFFGKPRLSYVHSDTLHLRNITLPEEIFGQKFSKEFHVWHAGDVTRIRILIKYGGIFVDNDSYIVRSLDPFRKYEMTIGITDGYQLGTQVLIAHKDARFLKLWLESYRDYHPDKFYFNAGKKPMKEIINYMPELVHTVRYLLGVEGLARRLYIWDSWSNWRKYYSIHLVIRHRNYLDTLWNFLKWPNIDENNICDYPHPFGEMARDVYGDFCPKPIA
ncbi:hypothetical protein L9F63_022891 [Diploptera punctata]|uniref:Uncharacterized protein n=1 Tax=Diploptera punctata TaxID=6984 RepID=A0AAD7ZLT3_DIPPU|nr:hypothetical protein L9F63_022891 [Diploptera punctata]